MKLYINNYVKVKLNEKGLKILKRNWEKIQKKSSILYPWKEPKVDKNGYTKFLLWDFMGTFGGEMYLGNPFLPFEDPIIIEEKEK
jgi:hypothetical protein